jgi:magnesium transporter
MAELDPSTVVDVAGELDERVLSEIVEEMAPDDAADVLADLPDDRSERVLSLMEAEEAEEVRGLMGHPEDSGGGIMTSRLLAVVDGSTVAQAVDRLRAWPEDDEVLAVYVVDEAQRLVGTVSLRRMLLAGGEATMGRLADRSPITVRAEMDQEEIAAIFADYDLLSLPVVDADERLVGQVTVDDIVDVIQEEATEDNLKMAATSSQEMEHPTVLGVVRRRLPWLLFCLAGTLMSGGVLDWFSPVLAALSPLVLFLPAIMAMGGNSGIQASTVTVRSLATGLLPHDQVRQALWRELRVAAGMGLFLGGLVFVVAYVWTAGSPVAACAGIAMFAAVLLSAVLGAVIPLLFRLVGVDPAVASGPLITTVNDVLSLLIYFGVAALLLRWVIV